jgi:hypothetical protein
MSDASRAKQVLDLCDQALMLAPDKRAAFLDGACSDDYALRASVDSLLQAVEDSGSFLALDEDAPDND